MRRHTGTAVETGTGKQDAQQPAQEPESRSMVPVRPAREPVRRVMVPVRPAREPVRRAGIPVRPAQDPEGRDWTRDRPAQEAEDRKKPVLQCGREDPEGLHLFPAQNLPF
jgi:hypothetical protein